MRSRFSFFFFLVLALAAGSCAAAPSADIAAGPAAPATAQLVAHILEEGQYERKPITAKTSPELLKLYLRMYDPGRMFFLAPDIAEFRSRFGSDMAQLLKDGDVEPAYVIFNRFMERARERVGWVHELVRSTYTFTSDETVLADRSEAPWPAGEAQARELWRKRVEFDMLQEKLDAAKPQDRPKDVLKNYGRLLDNYKEFDSGDVLQSYLAALAACYDPHSEYMAPQTEENFDISLSISLVGIGVVLQEEDGYAKVVSIVPGGPAAKNKKLHPNDRIEAVAQGADGPFVEAVGMRLDRLVKLIRGEKGTVVRLRVLPADALDPSARVTAAFVRDQILLRDQEARARIVLVPQKGGGNRKLGVIEIPSFYSAVGGSGGESTTRDVRTLLDHLKELNVAGVILDLRNNGGGSLEEAVDTTGLFTGGGPVVQVRDGRGDVRVLSAPAGGPDYTGPLVVLDSRFSASASEIVAAALKDYRRAVLVGEKSTYGKGTVQAMVELDQYMPWSLRHYKAGALKLTIQKFYRVSGGSTQNRGVTPDISLPSLDDYLDLTESSLPNAMAYDQIAPASYTRSGKVTLPEVSRLAAASAARVAASLEFKFVKQDIAFYLEHKKEKTVSLNYARRLAERKEDEARQAERNKERAGRKVPPLSVTDITLQDISAGKPLVLNSTAAMTVAYSSGAAVGVEISSSAAENGGYARAPAAGDFVLEEAARVLSDMIGPGPRKRTAAAR
jgi:carboxyl-terminal processing protease